MSNKEQIEWCLKKALEALKDYDAAGATAYVEMARQWNGRS